MIGRHWIILVAVAGEIGKKFTFQNVFFFFKAFCGVHQLAGLEVEGDSDSNVVLSGIKYQHLIFLSLVLFLFKSLLFNEVPSHLHEYFSPIGVK